MAEMDYKVTSIRLKKLREETVLSPKKIKNIDKFITELSDIKYLRSTKIDEQYIKRFWKKGISHEILAIVLKTNYDIDITPASLKKYEKTDATKNIDGKSVPYCYIKGMRTEYLCTFADFYGVTTDYLLGYTDIADVSLDVRQAAELTGLTPISIKKLKKLWNNGKRPDDNYGFLYRDKNNIPMTAYFLPHYVIEKILESDSFTEGVTNAILEYASIKNNYFQICKEMNIDTRKIPYNSIPIDQRVARYMILQEVEEFIDWFYEKATTYIRSDYMNDKNPYVRVSEKHEEQN